ncbi:uracil-DNA glycosylase family protein [Shewanella sp. Scap07]|nr:uracil-DNA glycosylase family protein [Shewanella sp. Scap07]QLE84952.1 uracil-DNA glycosylase family protein [Shewanella sp. Scap07]
MPTPSQLSLTQLIAQINRCQLCHEQLPLAPKPIVQLHSHAKILIAGQAPGRKTHDIGRPFDDASGKRLRDWLGVTEEQFYNPQLFAILPMGFCYPGTYSGEQNKRGDKPPLKQCADHWRQAVLAQLTQVELTLLVGKYAIDWHLQQPTTVTESVQQWQQFWPDTLVLPHPSPRNNIWLKRHPEFALQVLPQLKTRVKDLLS